MRASFTTPHEPEVLATGMATGMEREEALLVVAVYDVDALVCAVNRGIVALRLKAALLMWRTGQLLNALQDIYKISGRTGPRVGTNCCVKWSDCGE